MRRKANLGVILSIDLIVRSIVVDVDAVDVEPILTGLWQRNRGQPSQA